MTNPREALIALVEKWRAKGAEIDTFHATMGIGFKACADELAAALLLSDAWRPIDTAPRSEKAIFWIVPKLPEEAFVNSQGHPIFSTYTPQLHVGIYGSWSSLSKATHWMPLPTPPRAPEDLSFPRFTEEMGSGRE